VEEGRDAAAGATRTTHEAARNAAHAHDTTPASTPPLHDAPAKRHRAHCVTRLQHNGSDCGGFMTRTADYLARGAVLDFTQRDLPYLRRRMVLEILRTRLMS
jgi:hypothetical protein